MSFFRYKSLLKLYLSSFFVNLKKSFLPSNRMKKDKKSAGSILGAVFIIISCLITLASLVISLYYVTASSIEGGYYKDVLYALVGMEQLCILFLGGSIVLTNLYFSSDTALLLSLPIKNTEIFGAKFTYSYLSQFLLSFLFLPLFIVYGISAQIHGLSLGAEFYIFSVINVIVAPSLPMLVTCILSAPFMFLSTKCKNKTLIQNIVSVLSSLFGVAVYLVFFSLFQSEDTENIAKTVSVIGKFFVIDYHLCEGMLGNHSFLYGLFYVLENLAAAFISVFVCGFMYKKTQQSSLETGSEKKRKGKQSFVENTIQKALFKKDLKLIFANPTLLISSIVCLIMLPFLIIYMGNMFSAIDEEMTGYTAELCSVGFVTYLSFLMVGASNSVVGISVSLEKNNMQMLKSLPISGKDFILSKVKTGFIFNAIFALVIFISYSCRFSLPLQPLFGLLIGICSFFVGSGILCYELKCDLRKPNFRYINVNELTKNNKIMLKPVLLLVFAGVIILIVSIVLANIISEIWIGYLLFYLICGIVSILMFVLPYRSLLNGCEYLYERMEV